MTDPTIAAAMRLVDKASKAIEARDASVFFADLSEIEGFLKNSDISCEESGIDTDISEGRLWEAMRRMVGYCYVAVPDRLRPDLQALLIYYANQETTQSKVA